jgi:hypothetical protein
MDCSNCRICLAFSASAMLFLIWDMTLLNLKYTSAVRSTGGLLIRNNRS